MRPLRFALLEYDPLTTEYIYFYSYLDTELYICAVYDGQFIISNTNLISFLTVLALTLLIYQRKNKIRIAMMVLMGRKCEFTMI